MKTLRIVLMASIMLAIALSTGCEKKKGDVITAPNILDTTSTAFIPPVTTIIEAPANNSTVQTSSITFSWTGSNDVVRYEISVDSSSWISTTLKTYTYTDADEGIHSVTIRSIHKNGTVEKDPPVRTFTVNAITSDNSIMFYPRRNFTAAVNAVSQYQIRCENFKMVAGIQLTVQFDPIQVEITGASIAGSIFQKNGLSGDVLEINQPLSNKKIYSIVALPTSKGVPFGVNGSDLVLTLSIKPKQKGDIPISIISSETLIKDSVNVSLVKGQLVSGLISIN